MGYDAFYDKGRESFFKGEIDLLGDTIKIMLVDVDDISTVITDATNASPIAITSAAHGLTTGDRVAINGATGNTAANGIWKVVVSDTSTFTLLYPDTEVNSSGNGAYVAGGTVADLSNDRYLDDIVGGARVSTETLAGKAVSLAGVFDCNDITFPGVTGDTVETIIVYQDTGDEATSPLIVFLGNSTGLPATPSGTDIIVVVNADGLFNIGDA